MKLVYSFVYYKQIYPTSMIKENHQVLKIE